MTFAIRYEQLLDYADHERQKWRLWIAEEPRRLALTVQPGGRFPAIGELLDHVFLVQRRHLSRLEGATPPDATGIPSGDWQRLFEYADLVAADLRRYAADIDDGQAGGTIAFTGWDGKHYTMTRRRLLTHIVLHEVRHLAQIALSARTAGIAPPGDHDIAFFTEFA
jgi:uncharacterized damage-inducible protein DinB